MKIVCCLAILVIAAVCQGSEAGTCVEECGQYADPVRRSLGLADCPDGSQCLFNGCGHTCQKVEPRSKRCSGIICRLYCADGFQTDADGCPICKCRHLSFPAPFSSWSR